MDEGIVLDRRSFEALAVESRIRILKSLRQRRKTLSELADEMKMSVSGVKEHLQVLEGAELVSKMDDGHKWKYYELTKKGSDVVAPKELRVWLLLSISSIALIMSVMAIFYAMAPAALQADSTFAPAGGSAPELKTTADSQPQSMNTPPARAVASAAAENGAHDIAVEAPPDPVPLAVAAISAVTLAGCLLVLWRNRSRAA